MSLEIEQREKEGITILDIKGRLTVGEPASQLREKLKSMAASGVRSVVLNMKGVDYIDSTGLGTLVICYTTFQKAQGHLKLLNVSRRNIELLVLTKLETVFEVFADEQDAVNSFFPNREIRRFDILTFIQQHKQE
ncbi:MAG: STAS domain-containing protein [Bryobacteraceae bacterium]|nr:STAS domain-containing protein [Bryobacterales bacterium]MEB2362661.1 STAS domain-containing protein [Bryobacterales bacterium]NUN00768.1 STAS domain-containing protein [Bryobacteraceae bacterium]